MERSVARCGHRNLPLRTSRCVGEQINRRRCLLLENATRGAIPKAEARRAAPSLSGRQRTTDRSQGGRGWASQFAGNRGQEGS
ncbi:hypothetical protein B0T16DRAFT_399808 [Cercophora newfieldiana]|uniref:Uncharacterized protein n=1 Tax=Cercophora newfieldiana TaxID=92897 RepID=A0AA40D125_9PEZI|nr:hypothetical protein B0T16DRAFT_399808 [Cercophora newfieldiana]